MEHGRRDEPSAGGMRLGVKFALAMTAVLAVVMLAFGFTLYGTTAKLVRTNQEQAFVQAVHLLNPVGDEAEYEQRSIEAMELDRGAVRRFEIGYGERKEKPGYLYQLTGVRDQRKTNLIVPANVERATGKELLGLIIGATVAVIVIGAFVAFTVGNNVAKPLEQIVEDVRQISRGDLTHRTRVRGGGEVAMLARSIDRMTSSLSEAQDAVVELSVRERELEVANDVREALLPQSTPSAAGCDIGALHIGSSTPGGDFHDFIEFDDGRVGLLLCEVSGRGIPGAVIGAAARSYLRVELSSGHDVPTALSRVNRELARDVRRGMYVTALYVLLDPSAGKATVACAGHKMPLLRFTAADKKMRLVQPEGIALAFDKGPVFDRALEVQEVDLGPGDRLVLANTGPADILDDDGEELGEKGFYRYVLQASAQPTDKMLKLLDRSLEQYAGNEPFPSDITIVTVRREG